MGALAIVAGATMAISTTSFAATRNHIEIVGSSTVFPFATVVAERFGKTTRYKTPKIESTGSGGGMKLFCAGVGVQHPDITNASRRMKKSEYKKCQANGIKDVVEVKIGYDGIVIGSSVKKAPMKLSLKQIFLATAKMVPAKDGSETLVPNFYKKWNQIDSSLPNTKIEILGPPPTSGTRDAFAEVAMEGGCKKFGFIKAMKKSDKKKYKKTCRTVREDGAYIEAGENDNLIVQKLDANPDQLGIFGFSFLDQNSDKIQGSIVNGVSPEFEAIADGSYPISRSLWFYIKKAHVATIPGIKGYVKEFMADRASGDEGYLTEKGLIPAPAKERAFFVKNATQLIPMTGNEPLK